MDIGQVEVRVRLEEIPAMGERRRAVNSGRAGSPSRVGQLELGDHESQEILPTVVIPVAGYNAQFLEEWKR